MVLSMILGLVLTTLIYMGAKAFVADDHALPAHAIPVSAAISSIVGGAFGIESPVGWAVFSKPGGGSIAQFCLDLQRFCLFLSINI